MKRKRQGFTLIELLAVIVILALLLMIAIPGVTKYITQSRKKTITTTIGNFIGAVINQVNDMEYTFTGTNTIYAIPIECISLEKGGSNPFGEWMQANTNYWAYVLIQYDDETSSYTYGFTFKDSAGYGLYPTTSEKLKENGSQIQQDLDLRKPETGSYVNITEKDNWNGFTLDDDTVLIVLDAAKEGEKGDGVNTCTLCTKGSNYEEADEEEDKTLYNIVKKSVVSGKARQYAGKGYKSYANNVYFYNDTESNNVLFADYCWKIVRTTDTRGVKLIYNGTPNDGVCNNSGSATQIGTSDFSEYSTSLADVGYMNGTAYEYNSKGRKRISSPQKVVSALYISKNKGYGYFRNISYSNGTYKLTGGAGLSSETSSSYIVEYWNKVWKNRNGYYTCAKQGSSCSTAYYIIQGINETNALVYTLTDGKLVDDFNDSITLATDVSVNNDDTFTLLNTKKIALYDYHKNYKNYVNYYICPDMVSTTCDAIYLIRSTYSTSFYVYDLEPYLYGSSFEYKDGKYVLKNGKKSVNISMSDLENRHYTCFNLSGECDTLYYIYNNYKSGLYYLSLEDGVSIDNAMTSMLSANNVNQSNSIIKSYIEEWYADNMTSYTSMLEDTIYCNNRSISTLGGWNTNSDDFEKHLKFYSFDNNDLSCDNKVDQFTVSSSIGNGELTYPVGMITASEAKMWGGRSSGSDYWTMSAFGYGGAAAHNYRVFDDGFVDFDRVTYTNGVRPVVSLKAGTIVSSGDGSSNNPFIIE